MKVKIKLLNDNCIPEVYGNMIDLKSSINRTFHAPLVKDRESLEVMFDTEIVPLGVIIKLPKYFSADVVLRSSIGAKKKLELLNSYGVIDGDCNATKNITGINVLEKANKGYNGETDQWKCPLKANVKTIIEEGERICQFRIVPTMDCPWWVKLKYFFDNKIEFEFVDAMLSANRGGVGSSN